MYNGLRDNYRWQANAKAWADHGNLKLVFEEGLPRPRTDKDTMYLPLPSQMTTREERISMLYYTGHESNHHAYETDFEALQDDPSIAPMKTLAGTIWNAVEDDRVDYYSSLDWRGVKDNAEEYFEIFMPKVTIMHRDLQDNPAYPDDFKIQQSAIVGISLMNRARFLSSVRSLVDGFRAVISDEANEIIDKYIAGGYQQVVFDAPDNVEGSRDMISLAKRMAKELFNEPDEEDKDEEEGEGSSSKDDSGESDSESGQSGESDGVDGAEDDTDGDGESESDQQEEDEDSKEGDEGEPEEQDADSESKGDDTDGTEDKEETRKSLLKQFKEEYPEADLQMAEHGDDRADIAGCSTEYHTSWSGEFVPLPFNEFKIADYENDKCTNCEFDDGDTFSRYWPDESKTYLERIEENADGVKLSNTLRKLLQTRSRRRYQYGKKKGKIDSKNLHRLLIKDGGGYSQRVFKQKGDALSLDVALQLVVDYSGSMGGIKVHTAIVSANMLCDTVSRSLRVPVEVIGFSGLRASRMMVFKSFDRPVNSETLKDRMARATSHLGNNSDGEAIAWCYERLLRRTEKRRIMIVLSDGRPEVGGRGNIYDYTKKIIHEIEEESPVEIVGIGIMDQTVKHLYKTHTVIQEASELEEAILHVVQSKILTGDKR